MITDKATYKYYVQQDLKAHQLEQISFYNYWWMDCLRFQLRLRKVEYLYNVKRKNPFCWLYWFFLEFLNHRLATRLGFSIPKNVFGPGLCIVHYGTIVVNPAAKIGANCRIHPSTSIGDYNGVPEIGNNVYIGPNVLFNAPFILSKKDFNVDFSFFSKKLLFILTAPHISAFNYCQK